MNNYMALSETVATQKQIEQARQEFSQRVAVCQRLGVDPPSYLQILTEIVNSPEDSLASRPLTRQERRAGAVFQNYVQYQSPKKGAE